MKLIAIQNRKRVIKTKVKTKMKTKVKTKVLEIRKGMEYNSNTKLVKSFPTNCFMKKPQGPKEPYTKDEVYLLINLYVKYTDPDNNSDKRAIITEEFHKQFDTHTNDSIEFMVNQMKGLDKWYDADGVKSVSRQLRDGLYALYPDRFLLDGPTVVEYFEDEQKETVPVQQVVSYFPNRLCSNL
jgi:hypothetical protein